MKNKKLFSLLFLIFIVAFNNKAVDTLKYFNLEYNKDYFPLINNGNVPSIYIDTTDFYGIKELSTLFAKDLENISGKKVNVKYNKRPNENFIIIIGTLNSQLIKELAKNKKLDIDKIKNKWEGFIIQSIDNPFKGVKKALVIAGSDKRGTIYGMFDISEHAGVSPWYYWADVPIKRSKNLYFIPKNPIIKWPIVKYRGIFINDENPALYGWVNEKFGGFNHKFYEKVFELILRMKGNYLWPAMWGKAFYDDDTLNRKYAKIYGIVMGTSHHEPLGRAHVEWSRYGKGPWDYTKNKEVLQKFWEEGMRRMKDDEVIVTIGMRGDGDLPMTEGTAIELLEQIVKDQREIIERVTGKPAYETPQLWALYKEVQDYYDHGMRVPDDVTLLLCDDNWGNVRRLPPPNSPKRKGGYGMYYHFDFVGGPRSYKWLNTNLIQRVWEQMHLCYQHNVTQIWIVNVGDIKPMELPTQFFLDYAWNPEAWTIKNISQYTTLWSEQQFGKKYSKIIGELLTKYTKYNSRRKPEMLDQNTYSITNYREFNRVVDEYKAIEKIADSIKLLLPSEYYSAYYQLVLYPIKACANLYEMYYYLALNYLYAQQKRVSTNKYAEKVKELFIKDSLLTVEYHTINNGKWNHMMSQSHIGYTSWNDPPKNIMPKVKTISNPDEPIMGVYVENSKNYWPENKKNLTLPRFDNYNNQNYYIEIFNCGKIPFNYKIQRSDDFIILSKFEGTISEEEKVFVSIDWNKISYGKRQASIKIICNTDSVTVQVPIIKYLLPENFKGHIESSGYISIETSNWTATKNLNEIRWEIIPDIGKTKDGVTIFPVTTRNIDYKLKVPRIEYNIYFLDTGKFKVYYYLSPTLNYYNTSEGLCFSTWLNDDDPIKICMHKNDVGLDWKYPAWWNNAVSNNIRIYENILNIKKPGINKLYVGGIDAGVIIQKIVIDTGDLKNTYLGPPETSFNK